MSDSRQSLSILQAPMISPALKSSRAARARKTGSRPGPDNLFSPAEKYKTIGEISRAIMGHTEREQLFESLATVLRQRFPTDRIAITTYVPELDSFEVIAIEPSSSKVGSYSGSELPREGSHCGWVYENAEPIIAEDIGVDSRFDTDPALLDQGVRSYAVLPLISQHGDPIGTFNVESLLPGRYANVDLGFLDLVSKQLALALDLIGAHEELCRHKEQLQSERNSVREKDTALRQILSLLERERHDYRERVCHDVKQAVSPLLRRLHKKATGSDADRFLSMAAELEIVLSNNVDDFRERWASLTAREVEICKHIRGGLSTKEIADQLHLAPVTIQTHRENVRRKLGIRGKNMNLGAYLLQFDANV